MCRKIKKRQFPFFDGFLTNLTPLSGTPKKNRRDKFWTNLGFRAFLECCKGPESSQDFWGLGPETPPPRSGGCHPCPWFALRWNYDRGQTCV